MGFVDQDHPVHACRTSLRASCYCGFPAILNGRVNEKGPSIAWMSGLPGNFRELPAGVDPHARRRNGEPAGVRVVRRGLNPINRHRLHAPGRAVSGSMPVMIPAVSSPVANMMAGMAISVVAAGLDGARKQRQPGENSGDGEQSFHVHILQLSGPPKCRVPIRRCVPVGGAASSGTHSTSEASRSPGPAKNAEPRNVCFCFALWLGSGRRQLCSTSQICDRPPSE